MSKCLYIIVDVGCIECGEVTKVVGAYKTEKTAYNAWRRYLKVVGAEEEFEPASVMKLFLNGEKAVKNGELYEQGYFAGGQHSVEIHKLSLR